MSLAVENLSAGYGRLEVVHSISLDVSPGEIVAVLGRNGAGKSTTLLAIAGLAKTMEGVVRVDGDEIRDAPHVRARRGIATVLEGRSVFGSLTVERNIELGGVQAEEVFALFPELAARRRNPAGSLSGGEQQMLSLGRAICRRPRVLLLDEIDFGLAPVVSYRLFQQLRVAAAQYAMAVLLVEQHVHYAAKVADRVVVMNEGRLHLEMPAGELMKRQEEVERIYLGAAALADR